MALEVKVVTYNIKSGIYHPEGLEALARLLEPLRADVVALQEVDRCTRRADEIDQAAWLAARLDMPHHCFGPATPWEGGGEYGVALLSRWPLRETEVTRLYVPQGEGVRHGLKEPRVLLSAAVEAPGARLVAMVTHLGLDEEQRLRQARQIAGRVRELSRRVPVVLTGDMNGRPDSPELVELKSELRDVLGELPEEERITFPSGDPERHGEGLLARTIDYILVSGVEVASARVVPDLDEASDHNPCEAVLRLTS